MKARIKNEFRNKKAYLLLSSILLFAFIIRIWNLPNKALGVDEEVTLKVTKSISEAIAFSNSDFYPPLSHAFFVPLLGLFGVLGTRIIFAILSVFACFLFYFFARKFFGEKEALLSTLLFSLVPLNVFYAVHLRQYIVLLFLNLVAIYCLVNLLEKISSKHLAIFSIAWILMGYIHYVAWAYFLAFVLCIFIFLRKSAKFKIFLFAIAIISLFLALLLPFAFSQFLHFRESSNYEENIAVNLANYPYVFYKLALGVNISSTLSFFWPLLMAAPLVLLFAAFGFWLFLHENDIKVRFLVAYFLLSIAVLFLFSLKAPMLSRPRYYFPLMPLFIIFVSKGLFSINPKKSAVVQIMIVLFWLLAIFYYHLVCTQPDWNALVGL